MAGCDLKGLTRRNKRMREPLKPSPDGTPIPASTGVGQPTAVSSGSSGSGLGCDGPFVEVMSSDGFFTWTYPEV